MTRIIGGEASGRRLRTPAGDRTRPTTDRVREALFSALESAVGPLAGLRVLDLYAGSGAVGLEAVSRGAAWARLVESDRRTARTVLAANVRDVGQGCAEVVDLPVARALAERAGEPYDVVFADPPYEVSNADVEQVLGLLVDHGWLGEAAVVVVERSSRDEPFTWPPGALEPLRSRAYGETTLYWANSTQKHWTFTIG
ncbi:16S rRNA (guanine(966)-N(2))-methyltransferase RsmD [Nocardioides mangrovicus]|uniref:16S rRNA (Guanine(966)-N(2))-methyltransferase RsmD n=1 Tax=Nocardioides mangrovicus TaxID=2478913 RepID=A0A3L8P7D5_9ACTN|nr:16S rRNA (guanine(966)-N(2))-methyltransferase RsmD [Nocardioides mangrovicus]RLV51161.1 16S rRNA (guanine(966)-N(2))-methyltransferase RsmD [Nocardioides mangrovicus]